MANICTLRCVAQIKKHSYLTSCAFGFVFLKQFSLFSIFVVVHSSY